MDEDRHWQLIFSSILTAMFLYGVVIALGGSCRLMCPCGNLKKTWCLVQPIILRPGEIDSLLSSGSCKNGMRVGCHYSISGL